MPYGILVRNQQGATVLDENNPVLQVHREMTSTGTRTEWLAGSGGYEHSPFRTRSNSMIMVKLGVGDRYAERNGKVYTSNQTVQMREVCFASELNADARTGGNGLIVLSPNDNLVYSSKYPMVHPSQIMFFKGYRDTEWNAPPNGYDCSDEWYCALNQAGGSRAGSIPQYFEFAYGIHRSSATRVNHTRIDYRTFDSQFRPVSCSHVNILACG